MHQLAFAGCPNVGTQYESQLDRVTNWLRTTWRRLLDILNQKGDPL